ncbi:hypothetical protein POVWA1_045250 [Plasmodium ovale wallikeri]|uniref:Uncharacterized protein n=1 Tax=Plasmodium ovale wallikeri TaxID=864142 RepID=A0A1A8ZE19_PLAOA|nr:hypothetical protein POVWA1_045250 [Plasmodium ovale wallikeri]
MSTCLSLLVFDRPFIINSCDHSFIFIFCLNLASSPICVKVSPSNLAWAPFLAVLYIRPYSSPCSSPICFSPRLKTAKG